MIPAGTASRCPAPAKGVRGITGRAPDAQPLPRVDPALFLAALLAEAEARVLPAFSCAALDGLPNVSTSSLGRQLKGDRRV